MQKVSKCRQDAAKAKLKASGAYPTMQFLQDNVIGICERGWRWQFPIPSPFLPTPLASRLRWPPRNKRRTQPEVEVRKSMKGADGWIHPTDLLGDGQTLPWKSNPLPSTAFWLDRVLCSSVFLSPFPVLKTRHSIFHLHKIVNLLFMIIGVSYRVALQTTVCN